MMSLNYYLNKKYWYCIGSQTITIYRKIDLSSQHYFHMCCISLCLIMSFYDRRWVRGSSPKNFERSLIFFKRSHFLCSETFLSNSDWIKTYEVRLGTVMVPVWQKKNWYWKWVLFAFLFLVGYSRNGISERFMVWDDKLLSLLEKKSYTQPN